MMPSPPSSKKSPSTRRRDSPTAGLWCGVGLGNRFLPTSREESRNSRALEEASARHMELIKIQASVGI